MNFHVFLISCANDPNLTWLERSSLPGKTVPWSGELPMFGAHCTDSTAAELVQTLNTRLQQLAHMRPFQFGAPTRRHHEWGLRLYCRDPWNQLVGMASGLYTIALTDSDMGTDPDYKVTRLELPPRIVLHLKDEEVSDIFGTPQRYSPSPVTVRYEVRPSPRHNRHAA